MVEKEERKGKRIYGIKGMGGPGIPLIHKVSTNNQYKVKVFILGVDSGKEILMTRLNTVDEGPGYCHFPINADRGYNETYIKGINSEQRVVHIKDGRPVIKWVKKSGTRNEPLDLRNYSTAAAGNPSSELGRSGRKNQGRYKLHEKTAEKEGYQKNRRRKPRRPVVKGVDKMALSRVKQERLERLKKRLNLYYEAEEAVLLNQEYVIGTKSLKRADLSTIRATIKDIEKQVEQLEAGGRNFAGRFIPRDI